jgi:hypothetical protein
MTDRLTIVTFGAALLFVFGLLVAVTADAGRIQPVVVVPADGELTVAVEPGLVWYGWHGTRHGSEGRRTTVPACPDGDEALILFNGDSFPRDVKLFLGAQALQAQVRGTDTSITVLPTCDPDAVPIP